MTRAKHRPAPAPGTPREVEIDGVRLTILDERTNAFGTKYVQLPCGHWLHRQFVRNGGGRCRTEGCE